MNDYPDPTPEMLNGDPLFDAIWNAIKGWDISRHNDLVYSETTGNDARHIYDAIRALKADLQENLAGSNPRPQGADMSDIIERLLDPSWTSLHCLRAEAADEIERLQKLLNTGNGVIGKTLDNAAKGRASTIEECAQAGYRAALRCGCGVSEAALVRDAIRAIEEQK